MTTPGDFFEITNNDLKNFYGGYLVNNMILGKGLLTKISDDGKIFYMSSVAGNRPNPSINYSTLKGALQSFYISLSTQSLYDQAIVVIAPGLIYETPAFYRHDSIMYNNDISNLTTKKEIAEFIITSNKSHNGKLIKFGKDW